MIPATACTSTTPTALTPVPAPTARAILTAALLLRLLSGTPLTLLLRTRRRAAPTSAAAAQPGRGWSGSRIVERARRALCTSAAATVAVTSLSVHGLDFRNCGKLARCTIARTRLTWRETRALWWADGDSAIHRRWWEWSVVLVSWTPHSLSARMRSRLIGSAAHNAA